MLDFAMAFQVTSFVNMILLVLTCVHAIEQGSAVLKFSYSGHTGPHNWGHLSPNFGTCSTGKFQSPINILSSEAVVDKNLKPLRRSYFAVNATLVDHGFNVMVEFGNAGVWILEGKKYMLEQMHWHTPSEHMIDSVRMDAELHLVHRTIDGNIAVIAVLFKIGQADPILAQMQRYLATLAEEEQKKNLLGQIPLGVFKAWQLKRDPRRYYRYIGSLTTPPCTENVTWHIFGKVRSMSREQIQALKAPLKSTCKTNYRPVQPLNGRKVEIFEGIKLR